MLKNSILDLFIRLIIVALIALTFSRVVVLEPVIDRFFYFAADDPASIEAGKVDALFSEQNQIIISSSSSDTSNPNYYRNIKKLSEQILKIPGVKDLKSLSHGPKNYKDAKASPLWNRFLFGKSKNSSLIIIELTENPNGKLIIPQIEEAVLSSKEKDFKIQISGMPFLVEKIRVHLIEDLQTFSFSALAIFGLLLLIIFGSVKILIGTFITCFAAIMLTLIIMASLEIPVGILTANLSTMIFIITQSHIIFLTSNWKRIAQDNGLKGKELAQKAIQRTFTPSFWCMATTFLGFLSLVLVPAKPLKDLGLGGSIGTVAAMLAAYLIYPSFLVLTKAPNKKKSKIHEIKCVKWLLHHRMRIVSILIVIAVGFLSRGIYKLNLDPGLHDYFAEGSEIREGLDGIDKNGGSSILSFVISNKSGSSLDSKDSYRRMWAMQKELTTYPAVGTVISLAHLIAETERSRFSFLIPIKKRLDILSSPKYDAVAKGFITEDYKQGHFMMRLIESEKKYNRKKVIEDLTRITNRYGFNVDLIGGAYMLQEQLAALVKKSIIQGISMLLIAFLFIAYIISRSFLTSFAMVFSLALIPLAILGAVGFKGMPLDIFATPAVNVCIGIAVDAMIHLAIAVRLHAENSKVNWGDWVSARNEQMPAILVSTGIILTGFSIFILSYFPPTFRFGSQVILGTLLAALIALIVFPSFAGINAKSK